MIYVVVKGHRVVLNHVPRPHENKDFALYLRQKGGKRPINVKVMD